MVTTFLGFLFTQFAVAKAPSYPFIAEVQGKVTLAGSSKEYKPAKVKQELFLNASIRVPQKAVIKIYLDEDSRLSILEDSEVLLPQITEEKTVDRILLIRGRMRYQAEAARTRFIETAVSKDAFLNGDYLFEYAPSAGRLEMTVIKGQATFRGLGQEVELKLKASQRAIFQAEMEGGYPLFDILLKGRRVVRGALSPVVEIPEPDLQSLLKDMELKKYVPKPVKVQKALPDQICSKPLGKFNQCAWQCEKDMGKSASCKGTSVVCVRYRCNASGEWADRTEQASARCSSKPRVQDCDY